MSNLTVDCYITFSESVFSGHYRSPNYEGERTISGKIVKESYGSSRGQHTFTILIDEIDGAESSKYKIGQKIRRKGRNVYGGLEKVDYPENYATLAEEKRGRSENARLLRQGYQMAYPPVKSFYE